MCTFMIDCPGLLLFALLLLSEGAGIVLTATVTKQHQLLVISLKFVTLSQQLDIEMWSINVILLTILISLSRANDR